MSLINDALKRALESQGKNPPNAPPLIPTPNDSRIGPSWHLPAMIILLLAAAGVFIGLASLGRVGTKIAVVEKSLLPQVKSTSASVALSNPPVVIATDGLPTIPPAPIAAPPRRELKLQGIVYDSRRSWAVVGGQTVFVGDWIGDFRVKEISRDAVTLQAADGSQKKLALGK